MNGTVAVGRDYLGAVTRTAQYLAGLTADRDVWTEFGKVMTNFFGTDLVAFVERRPDGGMSVHYCRAADDEAACPRIGELGELVAQVSECGFLAAELAALPETYALALLPITPSSRTRIVMLAGHRTSEPLRKKLLDIYLAVAGLFESTLVRILSEQRLRTMADNVPEMLYQLAHYPDGSARFTYVSKGAHGVLKLTPDELLHDSGLFAAGFHPEDRTGYEQALAAAAAEGARLYRTFRWTNGGAGEVKYILLNAKPSAQGDGSVVWDGAVQDITERKRSEEALRRVNRALKTLSNCNMALIHAETEERLLEDISRTIVTAGGYHVAWAGVVDAADRNVISLMAEAGPGERLETRKRVALSPAALADCLAGAAIRTGKTQLMQDVTADTACVHCREEADRLGIAAGVSFPLCHEAGVLGALTIYAVEPNAFDQEELKLLGELASDLAFGINWLRVRAARSRLEEERKSYLLQLETSMEGTIHAMAATIEMRDPYTAGHQRRVADLARQIGRELGLPAEEINGIYLAAMVHDIGKIHVPAEILSFPGKLSRVEFALIKEHPKTGYDVLKGVEFPWPVADFVRQHHERLDGSGYPDGLKGGAILLGSRIISVADVVEAIAMHRPYRAALGIDEALTEITEHKGALYDADVVDVCVRLFRSKGYSLPVQYP